MQRLIIHGDPGIRKGARIEVAGDELTCFSVTRNGDYHGPDEVQLSCVVGDTSEYDDFQRRNFIPHFLETDAVDATSVSVIEKKGTV